MQFPAAPIISTVLAYVDDEYMAATLIDIEIRTSWQQSTVFELPHAFTVGTVVHPVPELYTTSSVGQVSSRAPLELESKTYIIIADSSTTRREPRCAASYILANDYNVGFGSRCRDHRDRYTKQHQ